MTPRSQIGQFADMIPYNTDAPLYHPPITTVGMIIVTTLLFFLVPADLSSPRDEIALGRHVQIVLVQAELMNQDEGGEDDFFIADPWGGDPPVDNAPNDDRALLIDRLPMENTFRLQLGSGLHPTQWLTSPFIHGDFIQLIFNMIALWAFGLVVEGKTGWWKFLLLYAGIGIVLAATTQVLMLLSSGGSTAGSGGALLGLLGIAVIWAPKNNFEVWLGPFFGSFEVSILIFGFVQFAFGLLALTFSGVDSDGGIFQIFGLFLGLGIGFLWLQKGWVNCENWDLPSVLRGDHTRPDEVDEELDAEARSLIRDSLQVGHEGHSHLAPDRPSEKKSVAAAPRAKKNAMVGPEKPAKTRTKQKKSRRSVRKSKPTVEETQPTLPIPTPEEDLARLITEGNYTTAIKLLASLRKSGKIQDLPQNLLAKLIRDLLSAQQFAAALPFMEEHIQRFDSNRVSLQLNTAKVLIFLERPKRALATLRNVDRNQLDESSRANWRKLAAHANQQIEDGVVELSD